MHTHMTCVCGVCISVSGRITCLFVFLLSKSKRLVEGLCITCDILRMIVYITFDNSCDILSSRYLESVYHR